MLELPQLPAGLHGRAIPLVLARLNDWVPQVRAAAAKVMSVLLRDDLEPAWINALPEVVRLMSGQRWATDGGAIREDLERFLLQPPQRRAALLACAPRLAVPVRRWLTVRSWLYDEAGERLEALARALRDTDARLAWQALRHLQAMGPNWRVLPGIREAIALARFPALQLEVLRQEHADGRFPTGDEALALAFSRHGGTRSWLLFHADSVLKLQIQRQAEALLDQPQPLDRQLVALQLLGELGAASLTGHLAAARQHPAARLREMGYVLSLRAHDAMAGAAMTGEALADPSHRVQRAARRALGLGRASLALVDLRALVRRQPRSLRSVLYVLAGYDAWTRALEVLQLLAEQPLDLELATEELLALQRALRHSRYAPTAQQASAVRDSAERLHLQHPALSLSLP